MKRTVIFSPFFETGGPEALHQLCDAINRLGGDAYIYYYEGHPDDTGWNPAECNQVVPAYAKYNIKIAKIDDFNQADCNIVFPEILARFIPRYSNANIYFWWLSVDSGVFNVDIAGLDNPKITHLYQSYYALAYLWTKGAKNTLPLFDYLHENFVTNSTNKVEKQNIVCFNPKKGYEYTDAIIKMLPNVKFVPLINMSRQQVVDTLKISKVYIDFGHHPGKDRFPREAALMDNIVIAGLRGSARFYNDLPFDPSYKFDNLEAAANKIVDCLTNYDERIKDFSRYRQIIRLQEEEFLLQTRQIFHG